VFEGTSPVQSYTVTSSAGDQVTVSAEAFRKTTVVRVPGLVNGTGYTFTVSARNGAGASSASLPSRPVTPAAPATAPTVPRAPVSVSARAGDRNASIHFKDPSAGGTPSSDGGLPILSYTITAQPGGRTVTFAGRTVTTLGSSHTTFTVLGDLANGTAYTVSVTANNAVGSSPPATVVVTPGASAPPPGTAPPATVVLDGARLLRNRTRVLTDGGLQAELATVVHAANGDLAAGPWSVMDKQQLPPSGDRHDYLSQAPFWWPGPNGCPYVQRDGQRNPDADAITDHAERGVAWQAASDLALAWFYTRDERYAKRAELVVRTWFLDPRTRQNPNFHFAQIIPCPGQSHLGTGIIESTEALTQVIDAVSLLDSGAPGWTAEDHAKMADWLAQLQTWLDTSPDGQAEKAAVNNHGSFYDAQDAAIALFLGQTDRAAATVQAAETRRIAVQVAADGSQPQEMRRTQSWHYSNFNLEALCRLAATGRHAGVDLWAYQAPSGGSMRAAVDFLLPAAQKGPSAWPKQDIGPFVQSDALPKAHAAAENAGDAAARAAIPSIPPPAGGDTWDLVPRC
jgi:hypothetical protein